MSEYGDRGVGTWLELETALIGVTFPRSTGMLGSAPRLLLSVRIENP
jgi:hypothetical protein